MVEERGGSVEIVEVALWVVSLGRYQSVPSEMVESRVREDVLVHVCAVACVTKLQAHIWRPRSEPVERT